MIILIAGPTHAGKTRLAQHLLEKLHYPYLSMDHLKMGLIRSGFTALTVRDDAQMTGLLWPIVREMIKTAVENGQNLIVEGCYIPFSWEADFTPEYRREIRYFGLCFRPEYIDAAFERITGHADCIEKRLDDSYCTKELLLRENAAFAAGCREYRLPYLEIAKEYEKEIEQALSERNLL